MEKCCNEPLKKSSLGEWIEGIWKFTTVTLFCEKCGKHSNHVKKERV